MVEDKDPVQTLRVIRFAAAKSLQSCPTLCSPIDCSPTGSPVPGILQARVLEWGAIAFSVRFARTGFYKEVHGWV